MEVGIVEVGKRSATTARNCPMSIVNQMVLKHRFSHLSEMASNLYLIIAKTPTFTFISLLWLLFQKKAKATLTEEVVRGTRRHMNCDLSILY